MSTISIAIFLAILTGGCFASWKGALIWNNRTRDARAEDPRDQEIRELSAALSVSRKQAEGLSDERKSREQSTAELKNQLAQAGHALTSIQQECEVTKQALNKEIESKEGIDIELGRLRRELNVANTRLAEIDVQAKIASPGSGLVAGMDDVIEDDEKEMFTIRHEHRELKQLVVVLQQSLDEQKTEAGRWKKHCVVMTTTNKTLRSQVDELPSLREELGRLGKQVEILEATQEENRNLHAQLAELGNVKTENEALQQQVALLNSTLAENEQLQGQVRQQTDELGLARRDIDNLHAQVASLNEVQNEIQRDNQNLLGQIAEQAIIVDQHAGLVTQVQALRNIEAENNSLLAQLKESRDAGVRQLEQAQAEIERLGIRVAAIDEIQKENTRLLAQATELRHAQALIEKQREQLATLAGVNDENSRLQGRIAELQPVEQENAQLKAAIDELQRVQAEQLNANNELGVRIEEMSRDLQDKEIQVAQINDLLLEQEENEKLRGQMEQISQALEQAKSEAARLELELTGAGDTQADNAKLAAELEQLNRAHEQSLVEQSDLKLQLAEAGNAQQEIESLRRELAELVQARDQLLADNENLQLQASELDQSQEEIGGLQEKVEQLNHARDEHLSRQALIETELAREKDENNKLTEQLKDLAQKLDARRAGRIAHDAVAAEKRAVDSPDSAAAGDDTDSLPALQVSDVHDDLKSIRGVGAKIEQKLNMLGICNFRDLLKLAEDDYRRAAQLIPDLEGRMTRDGWMDQARNLHLEKYNEAI